MSASEKAIEAVDKWWADRGYQKFRSDEALAVAHDPALGLDRSVCLRDVIEVLSREYYHGLGHIMDCRYVSPGVFLAERFRPL